ncbi:polysaccharide deacetylase family protein [Salipiger abyssi]|uniref:polysaccharide deacetylase family protein n=1 Tax=Salipiger abyssi TaxID=1250539 RepID=UPI00405A1B62
MSVPESYFDYPNRREGVDHDRFAFRSLREAAPVQWSHGGKLALWVTLHLEHFPLNMPGKPLLPIGGFDRPGVSVWDYTERDYGNRVGIFRLMRLLDRHGITPTVAMNAAVAERCPPLMESMLARGWEIAASGVDMGHLHHGETPPEEEARLVSESFATLRRISGQPVTGWHSPAHSQSPRTADLVAAEGGQWIADWINDDMPYRFRTDAGSLVQMPLSYDLSDRKVMQLQAQPAAIWSGQVEAARDLLLSETATYGGRILSLSLSPWVAGRPAKIATLDRLFTSLLADADVRPATGGALAEDWAAQVPA